MSQIDVYKFDRYFSVLVLAAVSSWAPLSSVYEFLTTGTIDFDAVAQTRKEIPIWILYISGWIAFLVMLKIIFIPAINAIFRGYVFKISDDEIIIDGSFIKKRSIISYKYTIFNGLRLNTIEGMVFLFNRMNYNGVDVIKRFLDGVPQE